MGAFPDSTSGTTKKRCGKGSDPEMWSVSWLRAAPAQERGGMILRRGHLSGSATVVSTLIASVGSEKDNSLVWSEDIQPFREIARDL